VFVYDLATTYRVKANDFDDGAEAEVLIRKGRVVFSVAVAVVGNVCMVHKRSINCLGLSGFV